VTQQHRPRGNGVEKGLKLGAVVGHADADQGLAAVGRSFAVADQIRSMAIEAQTFEHGFEPLEAPAALIGAVDHDDVLSHGVRPLPILILRGSAAPIRGVAARASAV